MTESNTAVSEPSEKKESPVETIKTVLIALAIALSFRSVAFEPFNIPSASMVPTLLIGDYIFVSKYSYGYSRYSFPFNPDVFGGGRVLESRVERGDVAVFRFPEDTSVDFIKRIVGVPGDRIRIQDGVLYLNGEAVPRTDTGKIAWMDANHAIYRGIQSYTETLPNGRTYSVLDDGPFSPLDTTREFTVKPDTYFAMGDNRDRSRDSRDWGLVPAENMIGRAEIIFFSAQGARFWQVWKWGDLEIRWERFFDSVN